jgi:hypothetical protein
MKTLLQNVIMKRGGVLQFLFFFLLLLAMPEAFGQMMPGMQLATSSLQYQSQPFILEINNAVDNNGEYLDGNSRVIITSLYDDGLAGEGIVFDNLVNFNSGYAEVNLTLYLGGLHNLEVVVAEISPAGFISIQVDNLSGFSGFIATRGSIKYSFSG